MNQVEWMAAYGRELARRRVPVSVMMELTRRCNLRCIHCYLGSQEAQSEAAVGEMDTAQVKRVIDEVVAAGCLYLQFTGGDPMMRRDFVEIYRHAREQGLVMTILCDGVLVSPRVIEIFQEFPPHSVEISLYGATAETYEKVTRVKGSFKRCTAGVRQLLDAGIRVSLKTVLMTVNAHELEQMRQIAVDLDVPFRMDSAIFPCLLQDDCGPLELRVDPETAAALELSDAKAEQSWRQYMMDRENIPPSEKLYSCGAGVTSLFVDAFGWASPCLMATHVRSNLLERGLDATWNEDFNEVLERVPSGDYGCSSCEMRVVCAICPAFNYLETGEDDVKSDYVCETTAARWRRLTGKNGGSLPVVDSVRADCE